MDRNGVVMERPKNFRTIIWPQCINGRWYVVMRDNSANLLDFKYGIFEIVAANEDDYQLRSVTVSLWGAKFFLARLRRFL